MKGELLEEITRKRLEQLARDTRYGFEEKHNGDRRMIVKKLNDIRDFNREGEIGKGLPTHLITALRKHPLPHFVIEVELVKRDIFVFDALGLGFEPLVHDCYEYRSARYHVEFDDYDRHIIPVTTVRDEASKWALVARLEDEHAEGVVAKDMDALYRPGRPEAGRGQHFKFKFKKSADVVVIGPSPGGKDSVRIGVFDGRGKLHEVSGVSLRGKFRVNVADVLEVQYLYSTGTNHIVQPVLLRKRTDKRPEECTIDQLVMNKNFQR